MANRIDAFLDLVVRQDGSDLHMVSGNPPRIRLHGDLVPVKYRELSRQEVQGMADEIMSEETRTAFATILPFLFSTTNSATALIARSRQATFAATADVDDDGDLDIVSAVTLDGTKPEKDLGDRSDVLLNDGAGHFVLAPASDFQTVPADKLPTTSAFALLEIGRAHV